MRDRQTHPITIGTWTGFLHENRGCWWIAPRHICEYLGLAWASQSRVIRSSEVMQPEVFSIADAAGKIRPMLMLPLVDAVMWIVGISPSKVAPTCRVRLVQLQRDCTERLSTLRVFGGEATNA